MKDGNLYFKGPSGGPKGLEYNHYFTLTTEGQTENLYYDQTDVTDVVFLSEAEDIPGMMPCDNDNMRIRSSNCLAAYSADSAVAFVTLPAGSYQLTAFIHDASKKYPDSYWSFLAGDREIANFHCDVVNIQEFQSDVFTLSEETTLYIPQSGNAKQGIDLIYITKQKQTPAITANNITMTYGSDVPELTYTVQNFDGELDGTPMLSTTATKTSPVGTYPIKIEKGTLTYENVIFVDGMLTITQAPLTVSVQDVTITRGEEMPSFTLKCEGLRNNETEDVAFTKKPTAKTYAQNDSPAGVYDIYLDGGEAPNYAISYSPSKLTILPASGDKWRDLSFKRQITHPQPMTGLCVMPWIAKEKNGTHRRSIQLESWSFLLCKIVKGCREDGTIIYDWSIIDETLADVASRGHQLVPRLHYENPFSTDVDGNVGTTAVPDYIKQLPDYHETYSESEGTYYADWSNSELQRFTMQFYTDFAKRYSHDPRLAFLEVGFGHWSEYHIWPTTIEYGRNFPSFEYQKKFLLHMSEVADGLPWLISKNAGDNSPIPNDEELMALNFGMFEDSFMREYVINGEYQGAYNKLGIETRWHKGAFGGEMYCDDKEEWYGYLNPEGQFGHTFEEMAQKYHVTYMKHNGATDGPYGTPERVKQASMATGYRFVVKKCATDGSKTMMLVGNEGVAPIYRDAYFAIGNVRSETSLKGLLPNEEMWIEIAAKPRSDGNDIRIVSDYILPQQEIEFEVKSDPQMFTYTVNEVVNGNVLCSTAGQGVPNTEITMPYRRYHVKDGNLYFKGPSGGPKGLEYNHYFTLTTEGQTENLYYDQTDITDVVFLSEAEDIPGMTLCDNGNMHVRSSNGAAAYAAESSVSFVTLPAGSYQLTAFIHDSYKHPDSDWSFFAGDREIANFHCTVVNIQEFQSDVFTLSEETTLYIGQGGGPRNGIDLIYITKQEQAQGIQGIVIDTQPFDVYNIQGHKVRSGVTTLKGLPKGVYLINGIKVMSIQ